MKNINKNKMKLYKIFSKHKIDVLTFCFILLGDTSIAKEASGHVFYLTEEKLKDDNNFTDSHVKALLFDSIKEIYSIFSPDNSSISNIPTDARDNEEKLFYEMMSLSSDKKTELISSYFILNNAHHASALIINNIKSSLKSQNTANILPVHISDSLKKQNKLQLLTIFSIIGIIAGIIIIAFSLMKLFIDTTNISETTALPTLIQTSIPTKTPAPKPTHSATADSTTPQATESPSPTTNEPITTETPDNGLKTVPNFILYEDGMKLHYKLNNDNYELYDEDNQLVTTIQYNNYQLDKRIDYTDGIYSYSFYDASGRIVRRYIEDTLYSAKFYYDEFDNVLFEYIQEDKDSIPYFNIFTTKNINNNDSIRVEDVSYDNNNLPISPSHFVIKNGEAPILINPDEYGEYIYDNKGNLIKYIYFNDNNKIVVSCDYNNDNLLISEKVSYFFSDGIEEYVISFGYDSNNNLILLQFEDDKYFYSNNLPVKIEKGQNYVAEFEYESNKLVKKTIQQNDIIIVFNYDSSNQPILDTVEYGNYIYYYNEHGMLIKIHNYSFTGISEGYKEFIYDDKFNLIKIMEINKYGEVINENNVFNNYDSFHYDYDNEGNIIKISGIDGSGKSFIVEFTSKEVPYNVYKLFKNIKPDSLVP